MSKRNKSNESTTNELLPTPHDDRDESIRELEVPLEDVGDPTKYPDEPRVLTETEEREIRQDEPNTVITEVDPFYVKDEPKVAEGNLAVKSEKSEDQVTTDFINKARTFLTQSGRVRFLTSQGLTRGQIVKMYPQLYGRTILYQHVRNILVTP